MNTQKEIHIPDVEITRLEDSQRKDLLMDIAPEENDLTLKEYSQLKTTNNETER